MKAKTQDGLPSRSPVLFWLLSLALVFYGLDLSAQDTAFTYQGRLNSNGGPATGFYDLRFKLFLDSQGNTQVGSAFLTNGVAVSNGLFLATIDFGTGTFNGSNYWLELDVKTNGAGAYVNLNPLQALTPVPYALFAYNSAGGGGLAAGIYSNAVTLSNPANNFSGSFTGNGARLINLNASALGGLGATNFWVTGGNSGTSPGNSNFLGTVDFQALDLRVNGQRAFQLVPTTNTANIVGGDQHNFVGAGVYGATIAGGGTPAYPGGSGLTNVVLVNFGTIGGGTGNSVGSNPSGTGDSATVAGGWGNVAFGNNTSVAGGAVNMNWGDNSAIGGGYGNIIQTNCSTATIAGGSENSISNTAYYTTISGGYFNTISSPWASIGGGGYHSIATNSNSGTISGGFSHTIKHDSFDCTISGGSYSTIGTNSYYSTIAGGRSNTIGDNSTASAIGGGYINQITNASTYAVISGGNNNVAGGGNATIGGGGYNLASGPGSVIGGGGFDGTNYTGNSASGNASTIGGGCNNFATNSFATVAGGYGNLAGGACSFAGGKNALAAGDGSFVWNSFPGTNYVTPGQEFFILGQHGLRVDYNNQLASGSGDRWVYIGDGVTGPIFSRVTTTFLAWNGAYLSDAGVWNNSSDRNRKTDFRDVDPREILQRLAALPIRQWRYTNEVASVKHLGPTAQDFQASFGLGGDDKTIGTIDEGGVALAAIQGLNQELEAKEAKLRVQQKELTQLEQTVAQLRQLVDKLAASRNGP